MENSGPLNAWTKQETLKLIEEYKKHSILYKPDHPDHIKLNKKKEAIAAIVDALRYLKPNVTEVSVKTKLKTLRHQLASEKKKINFANTNEMGDSAQCKPTLWCFDELSFLMHVNDEQYTSYSKRLNNLRMFNDSQFEEQTTEDSEHFVQPKRIRLEPDLETFQMTINKSMEIIEQITANKVPSKEEAFCQYLSAELRGFNLEESFDEFKMSAMILLQNIKAKEKKVLSDNKFVWRDCSSPSPAAPSMPVPIRCTIDSASSSVHSSSRRRSSSSTNDGCEIVESPKTNVKCEPEANF